MSDRTDTERLDWLEAEYRTGWTVTLIPQRGGSAGVRVSWGEGRSAKAPTIRAAIDKAMDGEAK